jgi:hypothetical protein
MPITFVVDHMRQRMVSHADGVVTFADLDEHLDAERRERALGLPELIDASGASTDITSKQIERLVQRAAGMVRTTPLGPTAIVVQDPMAFGMARMYSILMELVAPVGVFRDRASANNWLDGLA